MGKRLGRILIILTVGAVILHLGVSFLSLSKQQKLRGNVLEAKSKDEAQTEASNQAPAQQDNRITTPKPAVKQNWSEQFASRIGKLNGGRLNVLLMGTDARAHEASRSDSMILLSIDPNKSSADIMSIMRDSYVTIPAAQPTQNRINAAYMLGGPELALKTVSSFLQVPINYYIVTDFVGFEKAIDAIGGVQLNVEKTMNYTDDGVNDIHLKKGLQVLNGHQALGYARFRHDPQGDYARVERQRKLLKSIVSKIQGIQAVYYLPRMLAAIQPYIQTNMDLTALANLALMGFQLNEVKTYSVPFADAHTPEKIDGMDVLLPNVGKTRQEVRQILLKGDSR